MSQEEIDDVVCEILHHDGPDGHVDGHETITSFIVALKSGNERGWLNDYMKRKVASFV